MHLNLIKWTCNALEGNINMYDWYPNQLMPIDWETCISPDMMNIPIE
jgi:hypothetical protein